MINVFVSWSGDSSKKIAEELRNWIPSVLQFAKPYFTPSDVDKGARWGSDISQKLSECDIGIICLTKENLTKPWILFEAGALSKDMDRSKVCSVLFGVDNADISGPLTTFQTTSFEKADFKKMMSTVNDAGGENSLTSGTFDDVFEMWWPRLEQKISKILAEGTPVERKLRDDREILEEILMLTRSQRRIARNQHSIAPSIVKDLLSVGDILLKAYNRETDYGSQTRSYFNALASIIKADEALTVMFEDELVRLDQQWDEIIPF
ncbi:TIR domain-containing protein [Loktanella sp. SALINAS62]|uniref:TIR domain-containing protein n=1 Tax=Loktanella sp. SALINAS62 TaxID=2706124 RepID=UPI001B8D024A|nr:TIR domain-containing protein [Loktanella sp. SALINAS62]MBS1303126.1 TIR domain-containing protein [Loktanella sp. SALINAS62]